jgi:hypothetical protein
MRLKRIRNSKLFILIVIFSFSLLLINIQFPNRAINEIKMNDDSFIEVISPLDIHNKLNTTICNYNEDQIKPQIIGDGLGGAIIIWEDNRLSNRIDIYAQRINATGHPLWNTNGVFISNRTGNSTNPVITSDGQGGAIVAWQDDAAGNWEIYCQRINSTGLSPWNVHFNRTRLTTNGNNDTNPSITSDGLGGAFITWQTDVVFPFPLGLHIYSGHVTNSGLVDWTQRRICEANNYQKNPKIVSDGKNNSIITWEDYRSGSDHDIYAQKINLTGVIQWQTNGISVCNEGREQINPEIAKNGNSTIITWQDYRSGSDYDIYAQKINQTGQIQWVNNGKLICGVSNQQINPVITSDNFGGVIISWEDLRNTTITSTDIYSQRISLDGNFLWANNGTRICNAPSAQEKINNAPDGKGGAFITWQDYRTGADYNIYAQHVGPTGISHWEDNGTVISNANYSQISPQVVQNGTNGAVIVWQDYRNGNYDIYSQIIYTIDNTPPPAAQIFSSSHPDNNFAYSSNDVAIEWMQPPDASNITNYYYMWDKNPDTIPESFDHITDIRNVNLSDVPDGTWHFHVRANDKAGNEGETGHFNFTIDSSCDIELINFTLEASTNQHYTAVLEDFDLDGDIDIASSDNSSSVYIWWNPSEMGFNPFEDINNWSKTLVGTTTGSVNNLEAADLNYDGKIDLIGSFNSGANGWVIIWENNETPWMANWTSNVIYNTFMDTITDLEVGDYDLDGDTDVIFSTGINHQIFSLANPISLGNDPFNSSWASNSIGGGSYPSELEISDINRNGFPDIIYTDGKSINVINRNSSGWTDLGEIFNGSANYTALEIVDLDYNGKMDIIVGTDGGEILAYAHNGNPFSSDWNKTFIGKINETGSIPYTLGLADLGKNGYLDIIAAFELESQKTVIQIYKNNRHPFYDDWATTKQGIYESNCYEIALKDIDHNGVIDAAFSCENVYLARNTYERLNILPKFSNITTIFTSGATEWLKFVEFGDIDQDGDLDAVGSLDETNAIFGWRNNGGPFGTWSKFILKGKNSTFGTLFTIKLGDFDNDGWLDIVAGYGREAHVLRNDHTPWNDSWANYKFMPSSWRAIYDLGVKDFDHDGNLDIAGTSSMNGLCVYIWKNNGTAFRANWDQYTIGSSSGSSEMRFLKIADFDKDGWHDILSSDFDGRIYFWRNNHTPFISNWPDYVIQSIGGGQNQFGLADFDFDGDIDVSTYITYTSSTNTKILECDEAPFDTAWNSYSLFNQYWAGYGIDVGDLDSDGWADVVICPDTDSMDPQTKLTILPNNHSPFNNWWDYVIIPSDINHVRSQDIDLVDIDYDGDLDIFVVFQGSSNGLFCWENLADQDLTGPFTPIINSSSHPNQTAWYDSLNVFMEWNAVDPSGVNNYLYCYDRNNSTIPNANNQSTTQNTTSFALPSEGTWYFHIRGNDTFGNLGDTGHYRINIDRSTPIVSNPDPSPTSYLADVMPNISFIVYDAFSGVNLSTLTVNVEGIDYNISSPHLNSMGENPSNITFTPPESYINGQKIDVIVDIADNVENWIEPFSWNFIIDISPPVVYMPQPENNSYTSDSQPTITVYLDDDLVGLNSSSVEMFLNGSLVASTGSYFINTSIGDLQAVSPEAYDSNSPEIAVDLLGNIHIVWHNNNNPYDVLYRCWNISTQSWGSPELVNVESTDDGYFTAIAVDSDGNIHIVWQDDSDGWWGTDSTIFYRYKNATTGIWSGHINTTDVITPNRNAGYCDIGLDPAGQPHIVWYESGVFDIFYRNWNSSLDKWMDIETVSEESTGISLGAAIAVDTIGQPHVIWYDNSDIGEVDSSAYDIFYTYRNITTGNWTSIEVLSLGSTAGARYPDIAIDNSNDVHVVWRDERNDTSGDIYYRFKNKSTETWFDMKMASSFSGQSSYPRVAANDQFAHIVWQDSTDYLGAGSSDYDIFYRIFDISENIWSDVDLVSIESNETDTQTWYPSMAIDINGTAHIIWTDTKDYLGCGSDNDVFYKNIKVNDLWKVNYTIPSPYLDSTAVRIDLNASDLLGNAMSTYSWSFIIDIDAPQASNPIPTNNSYIKDNTPTISVDLIDSVSGINESTIILTVNGQIVPHNYLGNTISWTNSTISENGYIFNVNLDASDNSSNEMTTYSWSFIIDTDAPIASNPIPANLSYTSDNTPHISIDLIDSLSGINESNIILTVNEQVVPHNYLGNTVNWMNSTASQNGYVFNVELDASDNIGNVMETYLWSFTIDIEAPITSNPDPMNDTYINDNTPTISIELNDPLSDINVSTIVLTVNNQEVGFSYSDNVVNWINSTVSPSGYVFYISIDVADNVGNVMPTYSWSFTIDTAAPITSNPDPSGIYTNDATPTISADLTDSLSGVNASSIILTVNGLMIIPNYLGDTVSWTNSTISQSGYVFNVELNASDNVGNIMPTYSWSFIIDTEAPIVSNPQPSNGTYTNNNKPTISIDLTDSLSGVNSTSIVLTVNGLTVIPSYIGDTVSWTNLTMSSNGYVFNVELDASDNIGNIMLTYSWYFTIDTVSPSASTPEPADLQYVNDSTPNIKVHLEDTLSGINESSIEFYVNDILRAHAYDSGILNWTPSIPFTNGELVNVSISVEDLVGNLMEFYNWSFTVDLAQPLPSDEIPVNGSILTLTNTPLIQISLIDSISGINISSIILKINDAEVSASYNGENVSYTPSIALEQYIWINITLDAVDNAGNIMEQYFWRFKINLTVPIISDFNPLNNSYSNNNTPEISARISGPHPIREDTINLTINGLKVKVNWDNVTGRVSNISTIPFAHAQTIEVYLSANDTLNSSCIAYWSFIIDLNSPNTIGIFPMNESFVNNPYPNIQINLTDDISGINGSSIIFQINGTNRNPTWDGLTANYTPSVAYQSGDMVVVQVNAEDNAGNLLTPYRWIFIIDTTNPIITINEPNGGEIYQSGSELNITWNIVDYSPSTVTLEYSTDSGSNWQEINGGFYGTLNDGIELWTLPNIDSADCFVRVNATDTVGLSNSKNSDNSFIIYLTYPKISITSPSSGDVLRGGSTEFIIWQGSQGVGLKLITLEFSTNNGIDWQEINFGSYSPIDDGTESWNIPTIDSSQVIIRINITDEALHTISNTSTRFYVDNSPPNGIISKPASDDLYSNGSICEIAWSLTDLTTITITIEYSINDGVDWHEINEGIYSDENDGLEDWIIPKNDSELCRIRINATDQAQHIQSLTSNIFIIDSTPPPSPPIISWTEGAVSSDTTIILNWTIVNDQNGIAGYFIQVAVDQPDFENNLFLERFASSGNKLTLTEEDGIIRGKTYYYRICALDNSGLNSSWSQSSSGILVENLQEDNNLWIYIIIIVVAIATTVAVTLYLRSRRKPKIPVHSKKGKMPSVGITFPVELSLDEKIEMIISQDIPIDSISDTEIVNLLNKPISGLSLETLNNLKEIKIHDEELIEIIKDLSKLSPEEQENLIKEILEEKS